MNRSILLRSILFLLSALLIFILVYLLYVIISYQRIPDNQEISVRQSTQTPTSLSTSTPYTAVTYNLGFGAYTPSFTFFMDGGKQSVAESKESVLSCIQGAINTMETQNADFILLQEIDVDSTRSHHVNEKALLEGAFSSYHASFAFNYNSAYLLVPPWEPHGKSLSGLELFSKYPITSSIRRSLPVASGLSKFFDLDRCYTISRIPVDNGKELCIYTVHLSAYGTNDTVRAGQLSMLFSDMAADRANGNYVLCGGDFNHDLKADESDTENRESWAYPFPRSNLPEGFSFAMDLLTDEQKAALPHTSRMTDIPYDKENSYVVTLDGFIISDNIQCLNYNTIVTDYTYSDHEPVSFQFSLR